MKNSRLRKISSIMTASQKIEWQTKSKQIFSFKIIHQHFVVLTPKVMKGEDKLQDDLDHPEEDLILAKPESIEKDLIQVKEGIIDVQEAQEDATITEGTQEIDTIAETPEIGIIEEIPEIDTTKETQGIGDMSEIQ